MLEILLNNIGKKNKISLVISEEGEVIKDHFKDRDITYIEQKDRLGTGHAVKTCIKNSNFPNKGALIVLYGDTPFVTKSTIDVLQKEISQGSRLVVAGFTCERKE